MRLPVKVLTVNRHTAYMHLLCKTKHDFYFTAIPWNPTERPWPENATILSAGWPKSFRPEVVLGHAPATDLLRLGSLAMRRGIPYVQMFHGRRERVGLRPSAIRRSIKSAYSRVLDAVSRFSCIQFVFISDTVKRSWNLPGAVIRPGIDVDEMAKYQGDDPSLLVVANHLERPHFALDILREISRTLPVRIIGENPTIPGVGPARNWDELRHAYSSCRAFVNLTREPEDGYNLATLEAMATGMPVLTLAHPTSPICDGVNGLIARTAAELRDAASRLLRDRSLARRLGEEARQTVRAEFPIERFVENWNRVLSARRGR
jgi:glycosyltransferase involved in cell wall biosynthesis